MKIKIENKHVASPQIINRRAFEPRIVCEVVHKEYSQNIFCFYFYGYEFCDEYKEVTVSNSNKSYLNLVLGVEYNAIGASGTKSCGQIKSIKLDGFDWADGRELLNYLVDKYSIIVIHSKYDEYNRLLELRMFSHEK